MIETMDFRTMPRLSGEISQRMKLMAIDFNILCAVFKARCQDEEIRLVVPTVALAESLANHPMEDVDVVALVQYNEDLTVSGGRLVSFTPLLNSGPSDALKEALGFE